MLLAPEYMDIVISITQKRQLILTRIQQQPLQPQIQRGEWHVCVQLLLNLARALMQTIATLMGYASVVRQVQHVNLQMAHHTAYTLKM